MENISTPVNMTLHCPKCGLLHIDKPDPFAVDLWDVPFGNGDPKEDAEQIAMMVAYDNSRWDNPPHKTHLCRLDQGGCGSLWKPFDYATNGV